MKRLFSLLMALLLTGSMAVSAFAEEAEEHEPVFETGSCIGCWYTNELLNLMIDLSGWTIGDEEALKNAMGFVEEYLDESVLAALENNSTAYLLYASRPIERKNYGDETIQITIEKAPENRGVKYTAEQIRNASGKMIRASLETAGLKVDKLEPAEINLAGRALPGFCIAVSSGRMSIYEAIMLEVVGDYAVTYAFTSDAEEKLETTLQKTFPYSVVDEQLTEEITEDAGEEVHSACEQLEISVPKGWKELAEPESEDSGICFAMQDEDQKTKLELKHYDAQAAEEQFGLSGRDAMMAILEMGGEQAFFALVNGMESVCCYEAESDMLVMTFLDPREEGGLWALAFSPVPDEEHFSIDMSIIRSVRPAA